MTFFRAILLALPAICFQCAANCDASECQVADAAEREDWQEVEQLIREVVDVKAAQADGMTALHWAVLHDNPACVHRLIAAGADVGAKNRYHISPLSLACVNGNGEVVRSLIDGGANVHDELPGGETMLMTAARTGRIEPVKLLLDAGATVDATERNGQTALMWAAAEGRLDVVDALLKAGADFKTSLPSGFTPLFFAIRNGRAAVAFRLVEAGDDVNQTMRPQGKNGPTKRATPLLLAIENGHFELANALLEAGADPNARPSGYTALHCLTWVRKPIRGDGDPPPRGSGSLSSLDIADRLIDHGANVNFRLENGASDPGRFTTTGSTPFLLAARAADIPFMRLLLDRGADPTIANAVRCTPLLAAAGVGALENGDESAGVEEEAVETLRLLLDLGSDINAVDDTGETAMHGAAYQSWPKVVELLNLRGADLKVWNHRNKLGWTPLMIAQGHRPGNFRPSPETIDAITAAMSKLPGSEDP